MDRFSSLTFLLLSCLAVHSMAQSPTMAPTAPPNGIWSVTNGNVTCILAAFNAVIDVKYNATNATSGKTYIATITVKLPENAQVNSHDSFCSTGTAKGAQQISLTWESIKGAANFNLSLSFSHDKTETVFNTVALQYDVRAFPNATSTDTSILTATGPANVNINDNEYFRCNAGVPVELISQDSQMLKMNADLTNVRLQAYRQSNNNSFYGQERPCDADEVTTPIPVTTPATTPAPPTGVARFNVTNPAGDICLIAQFNLGFTIVYNQTMNGAGSMIMEATATINNLDNGTVNRVVSFCGMNESILVIENFLPQWSLKFNFTNTSTHFSLQEVTLVYNLTTAAPQVVNATTNMSQTIVFGGLQKWQAKLGNSYSCGPLEDWSLNTTNQISTKQLHVLLNNLQVQAFITNTTTPGYFGTAEVCTGITSDIVPIAVGCALAALVIIVLIAYVIGRRRNRARGYESM